MTKAAAVTLCQGFSLLCRQIAEENDNPRGAGPLQTASANGVQLTWHLHWTPDLCKVYTVHSWENCSHRVWLPGSVGSEGASEGSWGCLWPTAGAGQGRSSAAAPLSAPAQQGTGAQRGNGTKLLGWASRGSFLLLEGRRRHYTACEGEGASTERGQGRPWLPSPGGDPRPGLGAALPAAHRLRSAPPAPRSSCVPAPGRGGAGGRSPQPLPVCARCGPAAAPSARARSRSARRGRLRGKGSNRSATHCWSGETCLEVSIAYLMYARSVWSPLAQGYSGVSTGLAPGKTWPSAQSWAGAGICPRRSRAPAALLPPGKLVSLSYSFHFSGKLIKWKLAFSRNNNSRKKKSLTKITHHHHSKTNKHDNKKKNKSSKPVVFSNVKTFWSENFENTCLRSSF